MAEKDLGCAQEEAGEKMKLKFEKFIGKEVFRIYVDIAAVSKDEEKIAYAVQNMAYSLGYSLVKKER